MEPDAAVKELDLCHAEVAPIRSFDPMLAEALRSDHLHFRINDENGMARHVQSHVPAISHDPMLIEIAVLSALSPVAEADVASPPHLHYSLPNMVAPPMAAPNSSAMADLEMVRFDVQDPQPLSHIPDDMRNVIVARRTRETLPLHLFSGAETPTNDAIVDFAHTVCRNVPPPPLVASPPRRRSHLHQQEFTIRRSERLAAKSRHRATKPVVQAQNVMMRKLGITSDSQPPDASHSSSLRLLSRPP